jgi:cell division protein FtsQ
MSAVGRRRKVWAVVRTLAVVAAVVAASWGGWEIWRTLQSDPQRLIATSENRPVEQIILQTNGVLNDAWLRDTLRIEPRTTLMELDLYALRSRLKATGQVRTAVLVREFPATLRVTLEERFPVVRLKARLNGPEARTFLVARDGTVFEGHGYEREFVRSMPWLGGVRLRRSGDGFEPLAGLSQLADLLATARDGMPQRYATWRVVSLDRMSSDGQIVVQTADIPEIIFGVREDFYSQIARLDLILDETQRRAASPVRSINLAVGASQVPVALHQTPPASP